MTNEIKGEKDNAHQQTPDIEEEKHSEHQQTCLKIKEIKGEQFNIQHSTILKAEEIDKEKDDAHQQTSPKTEEIDENPQTHLRRQRRLVYREGRPKKFCVTFLSPIDSCFSGKVLMLSRAFAAARIDEFP